MNNATTAEPPRAEPHQEVEDESTEASARRTLSRVSPYLWPKKGRATKVRVVLALLAILLGKLATIASPLLFGGAVDALAVDEPDPAWALGAGAIAITLAYGLARLMAVGFQQLRDVIFAPVAQRALRTMALQTFGHIHRLSMRYHITRRTGGLSRIIERGVKGVEFLVRYLLFNIGPLIIELVLVAVVLAVVFDVTYMLVLAVTVALYVWFTFTVTEWRVRIRRKMNAADTEANQRAIDSLLNFETVKYFGAEAWESERYDRAMARYEGAAIKTANSLAFLNFGQTVLIVAALVGVMVMAARGVQAGTMTVGDFVAVNAYMIQITIPLNFLGSVYREIRQALVDMGEMFGLLDRPAEIEDAPDARALRVTEGTVRFEDVRFGYDAARPILRGVSISVPGGERVAIVGPSGAGKSTIGRLLFRFYEVDGGRVTIDGQDVRGVTQQSLHDAIGVVPQDTVLFNDTLFYNIAYGRPGATEAEVVAAARAARLDAFVRQLPEGYETMVGERGLKLSGGEKQRVGIARTLLKDPPILLLDEATSALDTETEAAIQESLDAAGEGRTVLVIAHRLSTIQHADRIVVLEAGRVAEAGTHADLLARGGRYADLWRKQSAEEAEETGEAAE